MAIAPDAHSEQTFTTAVRSSVTLSHTSVGTPSIIVALTQIATTPSLTVTYGGQAMSQASFTSAAGYAHSLYYLISPPTGAQDFVASFSSQSMYASLSLSTWTGTDLTTPIGNYLESYYVGTVPVSSGDPGGMGANDIILAGCSIFSTEGPITQTTDNSLFSGGGAGYPYFATGYELAGGDKAVSFSWPTLESPEDYPPPVFAHVLKAAAVAVVGDPLTTTRARVRRFLTSARQRTFDARPRTR